MSADPIQAAKERLTSGAKAATRQTAVVMATDITMVLAELSRLEGENERLRAAISTGESDLITLLMEPYADADFDRLTYRAALAISQQDEALADARRQIAERDEALKPFVEAYRTGTIDGRPWAVADSVDTEHFARAAALLSKGSEEPAGPPKRGDIRVRDGKTLRFVELDDKGEVWEILDPGQPAVGEKA